MADKKEHPQAKWLRAIADGETVEALLNNAWVEMTFPAAVHQFLVGKAEENYRIKPRTITIGKYEVAAPMKVAPASGATYYYLSLTCTGNVSSTCWMSLDVDHELLATGMCWLKREDAELAVKTITELLAGK